MSNRVAPTVFRGALLVLLFLASSSVLAQDFVPGREVAMREHLEDGEELSASIQALMAHGADLFNAAWTVQEGGGRPLTKGTGKALSDPSDPLLFPRNFNRISAPDANSCGGCHNLPRSGGGGDIVTNVFVLGQRFDHITFDPDGDTDPTKAAFDERGEFAPMEEAANSRSTLGMFGAGYIEMLARQISIELRQTAASLAPGEAAALTSKGVSFGTLRRNLDGTWDTSNVEGLPPSSIASTDEVAPSLIVKPFHQAGAVVSLREFSNNAFNHHHGIQSTERFGHGTDPDGDEFVDEMTRADMTAVSVYQATLAVPGRRIPRYRPLEEAVLRGEAAFVEVGCAGCHVPALPLDNWGWFYSEPNPFNPPSNLRPGDAETLKVNLNSEYLPQPRLRAIDGVTMVPAFTDLKLHDITSGPDDPNREPLNMQYPPGSEEFFAGNSQFLTKKLWGAANEPPFFHHGKFTTLRESILAHAGEAQASTDAFLALSDYDQGSIVEFLKTLQILPEGTTALVIDDQGRSRPWPPEWATN